jgi:phage tail-like protein
MSPSLKSAGKVLEQLSGQVGMSHRYVIEIDKTDFQLGAWTRAAGLEVSWPKLSYRVGGTNHETIVPGNVTYPNISLSRAAGPDSGTVQKWLVSVTRAREPLSGAIMLIDFAGMPVVTWELRDFFPISWKLNEFDSGGSRPAIETLTVAHAGFLPAESIL